MTSDSWNPAPRSNRAVIAFDEPLPAKLKILTDRSRSVLTRNNSPDLDFAWTVNPYRGCTHACAYCYARAWHEHLELGAGTDFERIILVKPEAPALLRDAFDKPSWKGELIVFSGVTDCYQPVERTWELTRGLLEVCATYRNPVGIITRSPLVVRDLDVLTRLARHDAVRVSVSLPLVDNALARAIEPGAPPPSARLHAIPVTPAGSRPPRPTSWALASESTHGMPPGSAGRKRPLRCSEGHTVSRSGPSRTRGSRCRSPSRL